MKNLSICVALLTLTAPLAAAAPNNFKTPLKSSQENQEAVSVISMPGSTLVQKVQENLKQGRYDKFLRMEDEWYQEGAKKDGWKAETEWRDQSDQHLKEHYQQLAANNYKQIDELMALDKQRDEALKKVAEAYPQDPISAMIQDLVQLPELSKEQLRVLLTFGAISPFPLHAKTPLLKQLNDIEVEYNVKLRLFGDGHYLGSIDANLAEYWNALAEERWNALEFEKLNKMLSAAQISSEKDLFDDLKVMVSSYPIWVAKVHDEIVIEQIATQGSTEADHKVADILQDYRTKLRVLYNN